MSENRIEGHGYVKVLESRTGYYTVTIPTKVAKKLAIKKSDSLEVTFDPASKTFSYTPKIPVKRG